MKYIGNGAALPGIPARDLTADEVEQFGHEYLLASGLYAEANEPAPATPKRLKSRKATEDEKES